MKKILFSSFLSLAMLAACGTDQTGGGDDDSADEGTDAIGDTGFTCALRANEGGAEQVTRFSFTADCKAEPVGFCRNLLVQEGAAAGSMELQVTTEGGIHLSTHIDRLKNNIISITTVADLDGTLIGSGQADVDLGAKHVLSDFTVHKVSAAVEDAGYTVVCDSN